MVGLWGWPRSLSLALKKGAPQWCGALFLLSWSAASAPVPTTAPKSISINLSGRETSAQEREREREGPHKKISRVRKMGFQNDNDEEGYLRKRLRCTLYTGADCTGGGRGGWHKEGGQFRKGTKRREEKEFFHIHLSILLSIYRSPAPSTTDGNGLYYPPIRPTSMQANLAE